LLASATFESPVGRADALVQSGVTKFDIDRLVLTLPVLPYDSAAASGGGVIRAELERTGMMIGSMDLLIAAHAWSLQMTLVTNNTKEFSRMSDLVIEDWS
jgi:tRNA(fMet)-specific endonuclease VapC